MAWLSVCRVALVRLKALEYVDHHETAMDHKSGTNRNEPPAATASSPHQTTPPVLGWRDCDEGQLRGLLAPFGLKIRRAAHDRPIPGSFWGDSEAGLVGDALCLRDDTPLHSALHEAGHYICMDPARRAALHTDAGGDYDEENAVCYLQILLGERLDGVDRQRLFRDMDAWGYSFRLGSSRRWFEQDAEDARAWLIRRGIVDASGRIIALDSERSGAPADA